MQTQLDRDMNRVMERLVSSGGMFETVPFRRFGVDLPMIKAAPASLADHFAHFCAQHGDATFIVDGDQRLSFKEIYAAARVAAGGLVEGHGVRIGDRIGLAVARDIVQRRTHIGEGLFERFDIEHGAGRHLVCKRSTHQTQRGASGARRLGRRRSRSVGGGDDEFAAECLQVHPASDDGDVTGGRQQRARLH